MNCRDTSQLLSEQLEHPLKLSSRCALRLHLWMCVSCRRFARQLQTIDVGLKHLARAEAAETPSDLSPQARERIRQVLDQHRLADTEQDKSSPGPDGPTL